MVETVEGPLSQEKEALLQQGEDVAVGAAEVGQPSLIGEGNVLKEPEELAQAVPMHSGGEASAPIGMFVDDHGPSTLR